MMARDLPNPLNGIETLLTVLAPWADKQGFLVCRLTWQGETLIKEPVDPEDGIPRTPNSTKDRAVLTLTEAADAVVRLTEAGGGYFLIGMSTALAVPAGDLDGCVKDGVLDQDTMKLLGGTLETYTEVSPSGTGARVLFLSLPDAAAGMSSGAEVMGVGLYQTDRKFVTLTGMRLDGSPDYIADAPTMVQGMMAHIAKYKTDAALKGWSRDDMTMAQAETLILEGSSLHDATMVWLTKAWNKIHWTAQEVEDRIYDLYDRSAAKTATPARWAQRRDGIKRQLGWCGRAFGRRARKIEDLPSQVVERAFANVRAWKDRTAANMDAEPSFDPDVIGDGPWVLKDMLHGPLTLSENEVLALQAVFGLPWDRCGKEGRDLVRDMRAADEQEAAAEEIEAARAAHQDAEGNDPEKHRWMLDMPSIWGRKIADHMHKAQRHDMPGLAALVTIVALSTLSANRYYVQGPQRSPLGIFAAGVAPTAKGKGAALKLLQGCAAIVETETTSRFASGPAAHTALLGGPQTLLTDEWARALSASAKGGNSNDATAANAVVEVFGLGLGTIAAQRRADARHDRPTAAFPFLTALYLAPPEALNRVLDRSMVDDGMLNRMIVVDAAKRMGLKWPVGHRPPEVADLLDDMAESFALRMTQGRPAVQKHTFRHRIKGEEGMEVVESAKVRIELPEAFWPMMREAEDDLERELGELSALAGRVEFQITMVAGLLCLGDQVAGITDLNEPLVISKAQMEYAVKLVRQAVEELGQRFTDDVAEGETDALLMTARRKLIAALDGPRNAKAEASAFWLDQGLISGRVMSESLRGVPASQRAALLQTMIDMDWIAEVDVGTVQAVTKPPRVLHRALAGLWHG